MTGHTARSVSSQQEERPEFESLCWLVPFCFVGLQVLWFFFCTWCARLHPHATQQGDKLMKIC